MAGDINLGTLKVESDTSGIDSMQEKLSGLADGLPTVEGALKGLVDGLKDVSLPAAAAAGAFVAMGAAAVELVSHALDTATALKELSESTGISVENLQPLQEALQSVGGSADMLQQGARKLATAVGQALADPTSKAAQEFKELGISQQQLATLSTDQLMEKVAVSLNQYSDNAVKAQVATDLLGRGGMALSSQMADAVPNIENAQKQLAFWGAALDTASTRQMAEFSGGLKNLTENILGGFANQVTSAVLPGLQNLLAEFQAGTPAANDLKTAIETAATALSYVFKVAVDAGIVVLETFVGAINVVRADLNGLAEVMGDIEHGNFKQAWEDYKQTIIDVGNAVKNAIQDTNRLQTANDDGAQSLDAVVVSAQRMKPALTDSAEATGKFQKELEKLAADTADQTREYDAAVQGLEQYKAAQLSANAGQEAVALGVENNTQKVNELTAALVKNAQAKQKTSEQVNADDELVKLEQQLVSLTEGKTEAAKAYFLVSQTGYAAASQQTKDAIVNTAKQIDQQNQANEVAQYQLTVRKEIEAVNAQATASMQSLTTAEAAHTKALTDANNVYREKLQAANGDLQLQAKITQAYQQETAAINANYQAVQNWQTSFTGAMAGANQGMNQFIENAQNLNKGFNQLVTQGIDGFSSALVDAMNGGKDAFAQFVVQFLEMIEKMILQLLIADILKAYLTGGAGPDLSEVNVTATPMARGGAFSGGTRFMADGGILNFATMIAPGTVAGEMGNSTGEAVLPLTRMADGELGVRMNGPGTTGTGINNITTVNNINVNGSDGSSPTEIARTTAQKVQQVTKIANGAIANQLRPGGVLRQNTRNAF